MTYIVGQYNLQFDYNFFICHDVSNVFVTGKNVAKISIEEGIEIILKVLCNYQIKTLCNNLSTNNKVFNIKELQNDLTHTF